jgi:hypothetical protein
MVKTKNKKRGTMKQTKTSGSKLGSGIGGGITYYQPKKLPVAYLTKILPQLILQEVEK